ncbi:MAG: nickel-dependent hydrogenase large subunit [Candidatus Bipolaricaulota bacterium]
MKQITIDPVTRIEGHLKIETEVEGKEVKSARSSGTLFRGFEQILSGRDPRDAQRITQRVCGVCPTAHATASSLALEDAFGIKDQVPANGRLIKNIMLGANFIQSHVLHFYHLAALDYLNPERTKEVTDCGPQVDTLANFLRSTDGAPFTPQYEGDYRLGPEISTDLCRDYLDGLDIRKKAHELLALFGAKMPHNMGTVPGGSTRKPDVGTIEKAGARLKEIKCFIDNRYLPGALALVEAYDDYFQVGRGVDTFLEYGGFYLDNILGAPQDTPVGLLGGVFNLEDYSLEEVDLNEITEEVTHSWYEEATTGHPTEARTSPSADKEGAYSWVKAPRYGDRPCEVGPAARIMINYSRGNEFIKEKMDEITGKLDIELKDCASVAGRHLARALECKYISDLMGDWLEQLEPGAESVAKYEMPDEGTGVGVTSAPRGTLGHWIEVKNGEIENYQMVVPTTWNASPRDGQGRPGPIEQALIGTRIEDGDNPIEAARIVRSFDPCMACAVH